MIMDSTFWVAVSFLIFIAVLIYFKVHEKINRALGESIDRVKNEVDNAEKLKEDSKNILSDYERKISNAKAEVKNMLDVTTNEVEENVLRANEEFHSQMENRKKNTEDRIKQLKNQALKDIKNTSVKIALESVEKLLKNSLDKSKLDKIYMSSIEETKLALKKKSS